MMIIIIIIIVVVIKKQYTNTEVSTISLTQVD